MKVAIITSTYTEIDKLDNLLESLKKLNYKSYKIYFIDDSGTGEHFRLIKEKYPYVICLKNLKNQGYSKSNNTLIKRALKDNPDYVLHLDDDIEISNKDWLEDMIILAKKYNSGISGCKVIYPNGANQIFFKGNSLKFNEKDNDFSFYKESLEIKEAPHIIGCCMLISRKVIDKIGLFDEGFSPAFGEDTDLCFRAIKKGFRCMYFGNLKIIHNNHSTSNKLDNHFLWYIKKRNAIRLEWKHFSFSKIIKYTIIHFVSLIKNPRYFFKRFGLLIKAYNYNYKRLNEIRSKK